MRRILAVPILLLALVAAAACSKPPNNGIASANGSAAPNASAAPSASSGLQALVNFAKCVREHGVNLPDPDPNVAEYPPRGLNLKNDPRFRAAEQACRQFAPRQPGVDDGGGPTPQQLEQLRAFAVCMRAHDIEMSDPELPGAGDRPGNMKIGGRLENVTRAQLEADPGFKAALEACKDKLPPDPQKSGAGK